jgi:hypothetical protein
LVPSPQPAKHIGHGGGNRIVTSLSGLIKGILLAVLTTMMVLLVALALVSLARVNRGPDDTVGTIPPAPSEPLASVPLGPTGTEGSVTCFRPVGDDLSFLVQLESPGPDAEPYVIGVDLLDTDGGRSRRTVSFPLVEPGVAIQGRVPESNAQQFAGCTVTAIQSDKRVILTGQ